MDSEAITAAAVDIGTNSVKLTVGRRNGEGAPEILHDATAITRLGKGVDAAGRLNSEAVQRTLDALKEFAATAQSLGATKIRAAGTSALRDAADGPEFVQKAEEVLGGTVEIISGDREAALVYLSARRDPDLPLPKNEDITLAAMDIGGGSTEVVLGHGDSLLYRESLQLGAVRLTERALPSDPPTDGELTQAAAIAGEILAAVPQTEGEVVVVGSGGTIANLAAMARMEEANAPSKVGPDDLHGMRLALEEVEARIAQLAAVPTEVRRNTPGLEPDRADVIVAGAIIQARALRRLGTSEVMVSARGLRFGLLYEMLSEK